jgi:hypothetical protein
MSTKTQDLRREVLETILSLQVEGRPAAYCDSWRRAVHEVGGPELPAVPEKASRRKEPQPVRYNPVPLAILDAELAPGFRGQVKGKGLFARSRTVILDDLELRGLIQQVDLYSVPSVAHVRADGHLVHADLDETGKWWKVELRVLNPKPGREVAAIPPMYSYRLSAKTKIPAYKITPAGIAAVEAAKAKPAPLKGTAKAVYDILRGLAPEEALTGSQIADRLSGPPYRISPSESTLRARILPQLVPYGLKHWPRRGYRIE